MKELKCGQCHEWKPVTDFQPDAKKRRGYKGICETCKPWKAAETPKPKLPIHPAVVEAMCGKKRRYQRKQTALAAALRSARRTTLMRVYKCPICKGWHLTHKPERSTAL